MASPGGSFSKKAVEVGGDPGDGIEPIELETGDNLEERWMGS